MATQTLGTQLLKIKHKIEIAGKKRKENEKKLKNEINSN